MSKLEFKPEDFHFPITMDTNYISDRAAVLANEKFNNWLSSQQVVYGKPLHPSNPDPSQLARYQWSAHNISVDTHTARLAFIEEIYKNCKHEPILWSGCGHPYIEYKCKHCGVELQATWSEVKK